MSDEPPGFNAPRRKARFRSQYDDDIYRRALPKRAQTDGPPSEAVESGSAGSSPTTSDNELSETVPASEQSEGETAPAITPGEPASEEDGLLPNFRLSKVYKARPAQISALKDWRWLLLTGVLLAGGLTGGYYLGLSNAPKVPPGVVVAGQPVKAVVGGLSPELQAQVDAAFESTKKGNYKDAREQFGALREKHPGWWSMSIEAARASLYMHETKTAQRALAGVSSELGLPDVDFVTGLLHLTNKELDLAETSFAAAVARDPARPDFFYFWGECLRRDGKPLEACTKFRAALLRNQYENAEGLYQVKLWISQIQADQEEASGTNKAIDAALATERPPYEALFAAGARQLKAKRYKEAAEFIVRARMITEPAVFRVILQDPIFVEEAARPEIAPLYR